MNTDDIVRVLGDLIPDYWPEWTPGTETMAVWVDMCSPYTEDEIRAACRTVYRTQTSPIPKAPWMLTALVDAARPRTERDAMDWRTGFSVEYRETPSSAVTVARFPRSMGEAVRVLAASKPGAIVVDHFVEQTPIVRGAGGAV